jgi:hypothetical protein
MTRMMSNPRLLGLGNVPPAGALDALEQFAANIRPVIPLISLTVTADQREGDFGINLIAGADYGKLMKLAGGSWINATPTANLSGKIQAAQIETNSLTSNEVNADSIRTAVLIAGCMDSFLMTGTTIRTAASGQRVQIDSTNGIIFIRSDGVNAGLDLNGDFFGWGMAPPRGGSYSGDMIFGKSNSTLNVILENLNIKLALIANSKFQFTLQSGSVIEFTNSGIVMPSGATVDGVDVSAHAADTKKHVAMHSSAGNVWTSDTGGVRMIGWTDGNNSFGVVLTQV